MSNNKTIEIMYTFTDWVDIFLKFPTQMYPINASRMHSWYYDMFFL